MDPNESLKKLHAVNNQLALAGTVDELCRQAVSLGRAELGFDRLSIWLKDEQTDAMRGTFGTDEEGRLRDERTWRIHPEPTWSLCRCFDRNVPFSLTEQAIIRSPQREQLAIGMRASAGLWDGQQILGFMSTDNYLGRQPITPAQCEILALFATAVGHRLSRLHAEDLIRAKEDQLRQSQKMEAIGRLASSIAHDFNNILTMILGFSEIMRRKLGQDHACVEELDEIVGSAQRASTLTSQLLMFSRKPSANPQPVPVNGVLSQMTRLLRQALGAEAELIVLPDPAVGCARIDQNHLEQVLMNLTVNARDAMPQGGRFTIATSVVPADKCPATMRGPAILLRASDTGMGMTDEVRQRLFEPFFTTKAKGKGTGLGMSIVYSIITQAGGCIELTTAPNQGTEFRIYLPMLDGHAQAIGDASTACWQPAVSE